MAFKWRFLMVSPLLFQWCCLGLGTFVGWTGIENPLMAAQPEYTVEANDKEALVDHVVFSPDGGTFAIAQDDRVFLCDTATGKFIREMKEKVKQITSGSDRYVRGLDFSPDGKLLACSRNTGEIVMWRTSTPEEPLVVGDQGPTVSCVLFSPDGNLLASVHGLPDHAVASGDKDPCESITVWNTTQRRPLALLYGRGPLAFSPDGRLLVAAAGLDKIKCCDLPSGKEARSGSVSSKVPLTCLAFSADGKTLLSGNRDGAVEIWDAETLRPKGRLACNAQVARLYVLQDNRTVITVTTGDIKIRAWNLEQQKDLGSIQLKHVVRSAALAPDEHTMVIGGSGVITLVNTNRLLAKPADSRPGKD